jgi:GNAT superfamily N-acetyltransferase
MIEIRTGDRRAAFDVPFNVYGSDSPYVSSMWSDMNRMLDPARNPFARDGHGRFEVFTAHRGETPVGRIVAAMHDASNKRHATAGGQFGFFDCADDNGVAGALLSASEDWLRARGAKEIVGNFNLTAMQMSGVLTDGFDAQPYTDMMWTPPHIMAHLRRCGYEAAFPMTTFETDLEKVDLQALNGPRQRSILADNAFTWHRITRRTFGQRMEDARQILNAGFDKNPRFVPLTREEYEFQAGEMMWIMDPRLSTIVRHRGRPAGAIICIPDLNPMVRACRSRMSCATPWHFLRHRLKRDRAVIIYYSVVPELHGRGLNGAMLGRLILEARNGGYRKLGTTWIADVNGASLRQMQRIGAKPLHRLHLFAKQMREQA